MNPLQQVRSTAADARSREGLRPLDLDELLALEIKPREMVLDPIIPEKSLTMIYGLRGIGKTHVALGIACAVASGTHMLGWRAPKPRRVLLIDGESPGVMLRERLQSVAGRCRHRARDAQSARRRSRRRRHGKSRLAGGAGRARTNGRCGRSRHSRQSGEPLGVLSRRRHRVEADRAVAGASAPTRTRGADRASRRDAAARRAAPAGARTCSTPRSACSDHSITRPRRAHASRSISRRAASFWARRRRHSRRNSRSSEVRRCGP